LSLVVTLFILGHSTYEPIKHKIMAGGKESPRQKMIGMMYLVLTALLALNVSKSILDAFVAIEENIQKANAMQFEVGSRSILDVKSELAGLKQTSENSAKIKKIKFVISKMKDVERATDLFIKSIDDIKLNLLTKSGENITFTRKNTESSAIIWEKPKAECSPIRFNLSAVNAKDQYDIPMNILIGGDIKNPSGVGKDVWKELIDLRKDLATILGNYSWNGKVNKLNCQNINSYSNNVDLAHKVDAFLIENNVSKDDYEVIKKLYMSLTKQERVTVNDMKNVHWIGATFDHSPLVAAIASLSSLQQDALAARSLALGHLKSKVSTGEYSFNSIVPLAYGPVIANIGDEVNLNIMMAAFDSENQPIVTLDNDYENEINYSNGQGHIKLKAGTGNLSLTGTISIKNKNGLIKKEKWNHEVLVMKPQGSIEMPQFNLLYRGYENIIVPTASGYNETILTGNNVTIIKKSDHYIVKPGNGGVAKLVVTGKNSATNDSKVLKSITYKVVDLPDPVLFWGSSKTGGNANSSRVLIPKFEPGNPLNVNWNIIKWECSSSSLRGAPPTGSGNNISQANALINASPKGTMISFLATVTGPDNRKRQIAGSWIK
jgi:gliding motility-associated protein GldM